jgi:Ser/Thr protein kinase RdoA (MazF antagonist)
MLKSAQYWSDTLRPLGIPLPEVLGANFEGTFPYMLLERLDGRDLGEVYPRLSSEVRRAVATSVASWQSLAASLPEGKGFGYGASFDDPKLLRTWLQVLDAQLERTRGWMRSGGVGDLSFVDRIQELLHGEQAYLDGITPRPFLHDTTTKNVLVSEAGVHGVVDVDDVCFGDRLYVLSLTTMAFISSRFDEEYIRFWEESWQLQEHERRIVRLYTAAHCVGFISELGLRFNKEGDVSVDENRKIFLEQTFESLLTA